MSERLSKWLWQAAAWLARRLQPARGWVVFALCIALSLVPILGGDARWRSVISSFWLVGPLAVIAVYLVPTHATSTRFVRWQQMLAAVWLALAGIAVVAQALVGWLPTLLELLRTAQSGAWTALALNILTDWASLGTRLSLWWGGVQSGNATQDSWIVATWLCALLWLASAASAWLVKRPLTPTARLAEHKPSGLQAALPLLAFITALLLYGDGTRTHLVAGLMLALALHAALDQHERWREWTKRGWPHGGGLGSDRAAAVALVIVPLLLAALLVPNLRVRPLASFYYRTTEPLRAPLVALSERAFPDLRRSYGLNGSGPGGLPNAFLIDGAPNLSDREVLRVRTDETVRDVLSLPEEFAQQIAPPLGHYLRGGTLVVYTGRSWENPGLRTRVAQPAGIAVASDTLPSGRRLLTQNIVMQIDSRVLYAAPEPLTASVPHEVDWRAQSTGSGAAASTLGDLVALRIDQPEQASSYTVVSAVADVDPADLADVPMWEADDLSPALAGHLELPPEISERTRQLANEITQGLETPYERARAIEQFLRRYAYDLDVPSPPSGVEIADYFLFELERGYCDYYATAFAVLARLNGLPTRFATGFAVGTWNSDLEARIVTEAEAHSWPEVYFPRYGWIAFEPTAGRPELPRVDTTPEEQTARVAPAELPAFEPLPSPRISLWARLRGSVASVGWNWQMLIWLLPLVGIGWGVVALLNRWLPGWQTQWWAVLRSPRWWRVLRTRDPWVGLLRWGRAVGRPLHEEETVLEYGTELAEHVRERVPSMEAARLASREVLTLSRAVSDSRYAARSQREAAASRAVAAWAELRSHVRRGL